MDIKVSYLDHNILKSYYTCDDVLTNVICMKGTYMCARVSYIGLPDNIRVVLKIFSDDKIVVGLNIESTNATECFICVNDFIISQFHVSKGKFCYPQLILQRYNDIKIILDERFITNVELLSIRQSKCYITSRYMTTDDVSTHRIIKIGDFSPSIMYHSLCKCGMKCSYSDSNDMYDYKYYYISYGITKIHPLVKFSKGFVEG